MCSNAYLGICMIGALYLLLHTPLQLCVYILCMYGIIHEIYGEERALPIEKLAAYSLGIEPSILDRSLQYPFMFILCSEGNMCML